MKATSKGIGIFKKGKNNNHNPSNTASRASNYSSRRNDWPQTIDKNNQAKSPVVDEASWMGNQTPRNQNYMKIQNSEETRENQPFHKSANNKSKTQQIKPEQLLSSLIGKSESKAQQPVSTSPTKFIQQILKGISNQSLSLNNASPYYSSQSEELLTQLLTNPNKMNSYIQDLQAEMGDQPENVSQNYELLIVLLQNIRKSDLEVRVTSEKGLELNFNTKVLAKQEHEIENLEKKIKQKDDQLKEIVEDYEAVIKNFNAVIEKLLEERETKYGNSFKYPNLDRYEA